MHWGRHLWSRGYFCSTVGSATDPEAANLTDHNDIIGVVDNPPIEESKSHQFHL